MWVHSILDLVLILAGFAAGSFAWKSALGESPYWWIGGVIGAAIGCAIAALVMKSIGRAPVIAPPTPEPQRKTPDRPPTAAPPTPKAPVRNDAITLLAALQREARLVDFLQESLAGYSDAQIGAVARDIHRDCGTVLARVFALQPAVADAEGAEIEIPTGFDPARWRLVGNVTGEPPYRGRIVHQGWEATTCQLPTWTGAAAAAKIVAPAEVELK